MKVHDESKAFKCDVCLKMYSKKSRLEAHYRNHTNEKPFVCKICCKNLLTNIISLTHESS